MLLDWDGKREFLRDHDIRVERSTRPDGTEGIHVVIDGEDHGVLRVQVSPELAAELGVAGP